MESFEETAIRYARRCRSCRMRNASEYDPDSLCHECRGRKAADNAINRLRDKLRHTADPGPIRGEE